MFEKFIIIILIFNTHLVQIVAQELNAEQIYEKYNDAVVMIKSIGFNGKLKGQGSGIIINDSGYVVTNYHNFKESERILIEHFGKQYSGDLIVGADIIRDLLIIKLKGNQFPSIKQADLSKVRVGQKIFTLGSPWGLENTLSEGIISKIGYYPQFNRNYIQFTAPISPGSSGGAVINSRGELIGISSAGVVPGQNLNLAIPVDEIKNVNLISINDKQSIKLLSLYYRGINAQDADEYSKSIGIFKEFINIDSNHAPIYYNLGLAYEYLEEPDSAIFYFELTIKKNPQFALAYSELGLIYTSLGDYTKAESLYNKAIHLNPKLSNAYSNMGGMYLYKEEYDKGIFYSEKALVLNKYYDGTYNNLAVAHQSLKEFEKALDYINKGLIINPGSDLCYLTLARINREMGDYYKAIDNFLKVIEIDKNIIKAFIELGNTYLEVEEYDNAFKYFNRAIYTHKNSKKKIIGDISTGYNELAQTYFGLGRVYVNRRDFKKASKYFQDCIKVDSNVVAAYAALALTYREKKDTSNALFFFEKAVSKDTSLWKFYYDIGNIYLNQTKYQQAIESYSNYLNHDGTNPKVLYRISSSYYNIYSLDSSKIYLEKLLLIDSTYSDGYNLIGAIYCKNKNFNAAEGYFLKAIKYNVQNGGFYFNLGKVYLDMGKKEEAIPHIQKSAKLNYKPAKDWLEKNK